MNAKEISYSIDLTLPTTQLRASIERAIRDAQARDRERDSLRVDRAAGVHRTESDRAAETGELTAEQLGLVLAIDAYRRANGVITPPWTAVLMILRKLGYRKTQTSLVQLAAVEDFTEAADAPVERKT